MLSFSYLAFDAAWYNFIILIILINFTILTALVATRDALDCDASLLRSYELFLIYKCITNLDQWACWYLIKVLGLRQGQGKNKMTIYTQLILSSLMTLRSRKEPSVLYGQYQMLSQLKHQLQQCGYHQKIMSIEIWW